MSRILKDYPSYISLTETIPVKTGLFEIETELQVRVPTVEGFLGDKLTAYTMGVPFVTEKGNSMTMQVIKQLYDIGELFDIVTNFDNIKYDFDTEF